MSETPRLLIEGLEKTYQTKSHRLTILKGLNISVYSGDMVALVGQSGSGKSTLLQIAGLLDQPTAGTVIVGGHDVSTLSDKDRTSLRRNHIGFIYQFHHLLPEFTALENAAMPLIINGIGKKEAYAQAADLLSQVGLAERLDHRPAELSGGEQQRVAIARALVNDPKILLADEPTGNLDPETSERVFEILVNQARQRDLCAVIATHNHALARRMEKFYVLEGGTLRDGD